ncbi:leucine-rich repeat extensin-like protein 1 [Prosopis cineraria]|uniref:leucine-rich repeat extensin-like protein 1 n=1 Tax=Prosopis cineraria TaxID=364024 RepID=UPI00240F3FFD|nr:leucine-rich repeat extensin-like protein 1 [Prosopis cineraria]
MPFIKLIQLQKVVSEGFEELSCPFHKGNDRHLAGGELELVLQCTTQSKNNPSSLERLPTQNYPQYSYASHNFSANPTLSYWPPLVFNHPPLYPPPQPPPHCLPSYPSSLPHYLLSAYPSPPPHQYYSPLYPFPPPLLLPHYPPQYQVPSSQPLPPHLRPSRSSLSSLLLPIKMVSSIASIGSSMFQFFEE